jgi:hypothetical protein
MVDCSSPEYGCRANRQVSGAITDWLRLIPEIVNQSDTFHSIAELLPDFWPLFAERCESSQWLLKSVARCVLVAGLTLWLWTWQACFHQPIVAHEHWHINVSNLNIRGTFSFCATILDGLFLSLVHWDIRPEMKELGIEAILQFAKEKYPDARLRFRVGLWCEGRFD